VRVLAAASIALALAGLTAFTNATSTARDTVRLVRVPNNGIQPEATFDARGVLHVLYFSGEPSSGNLFYVRSSDGGSTFSTPVRVNSQDGSAVATGTIRGGQLAVGRNGRLHIVWNGSDSALPKAPATPSSGRPGSPLLYSRSNAEGTAFETQRGLIHHSYDLDGGGSVAADADGRVYAAWHGSPMNAAAGEERRRVWIARSEDDGASFADEGIAWNEPTGTCGCCGMRMLAGPSRSLIVLYRSASTPTDRDVFVLTSTDGGGSFRGSRVQPWHIGSCPMTSMALTTVGNRIVGAWETAGQVSFGAIDLAGARIPEPVAAPGPAGSRKHPRLAVNTRGETMLVWTEGTAWARGGSMAWQVFDSSGHPTSQKGSEPGIPVWSFAAVATRPDGGFLILY
jgi:hypothetical protein